MRLPGLYNRKDKTFFFLSYEDLILQAPNAAQAYFVPSTTLDSEASPVFKISWPLSPPAGLTWARQSLQTLVFHSLWVVFQFPAESIQPVCAWITR